MNEQIVSRTAMQLLRRILRVTDEGTREWQESNTAVARSLHVDPPTIKRAVHRFCAVGLLRAIETKGGRGHASIYAVDEWIARDLLASGRWPADLPNRRTEEAQKAGHREKPAQRMRPFHEDASSRQTPPRGARQDASPNSDTAHGGQPLLGDLDPSVLAGLSARYGIPAAPLSPVGIRQWWQAQPEAVRRPATATSIGALLVVQPPVWWVDGERRWLLRS